MNPDQSHPNLHKNQSKAKTFKKPINIIAESNEETLTPMEQSSPDLYYEKEKKTGKSKVILNQPSVLDELEDDLW